MVKTIALTGGMGCGKSTAAEAFEELGAKVIDTDKLSHYVLEHDSRTVAEVKRIVGENAYGDGGKPDRAQIAKTVFSDAEKLESLEKAIHPAIEKIWRAEVEEYRISGEKKFVVVEVPLLFEKRLEKKFDICVTVFCSEELRKKRLAQRGLSPTQISERDSYQMSPAEKAKLADIVLFNESDKAFLKRQVELVLSRLK